MEGLENPLSKLSSQRKRSVEENDTTLEISVHLINLLRFQVAMQRIFLLLIMSYTVMIRILLKLKAGWNKTIWFNISTFYFYLDDERISKILERKRCKNFLFHWRRISYWFRISNNQQAFLHITAKMTLL